MNPPPANRSALVYYVNGHGFGHATRSIAVLNEVWDLRPDQTVFIRTTAPGFLFESNCKGRFRLLEGEIDPGTVQSDPLRLDREASLQARARHQQRLPALVRHDVAQLSSLKVGLIAADIPPLAFEVAAELGVPSVALGNFSWDWIYEPWIESRPERAELVESMRRSYGRADLLLRMPLHGDMSAFRQVEDIPHVVRPMPAERAGAREALALGSETRPLVLVSFGGFEGVRLRGPARPGLEAYRFITFGRGIPGLPADTVMLPMDHRYHHEALVAASDAVITKPGYGTVAECLAARTPLLYTSRDDFREYPVLVDGIRRDAHARFLPREDLLELRWAPHLDALLGAKPSWADVRTDGARVAAERLLGILDDPDRA